MVHQEPRYFVYQYTSAQGDCSWAFYTTTVVVENKEVSSRLEASFSAAAKLSQRSRDRER